MKSDRIEALGNPARHRRLPRGFMRKTFLRWLEQNRRHFLHAPYPLRDYKPPPDIPNPGQSLWLRFRGVIPQLQCAIRGNGFIEIWAIHRNKVTDIITDFDAHEQRTPDGRWYCESCRRKKLFPSRTTLWEHHFGYLLEWTNKNLTRTHRLYACASPGGSNAAMIVRAKDERKIPDFMSKHALSSLNGSKFSFGFFRKWPVVHPKLMDDGK